MQYPAAPFQCRERRRAELHAVLARFRGLHAKEQERAAKFKEDLTPEEEAIVAAIQAGLRGTRLVAYADLDQDRPVFGADGSRPPPLSGQIGRYLDALASDGCDLLAAEAYVGAMVCLLGVHDDAALAEPAGFIRLPGELSSAATRVNAAALEWVWSLLQHGPKADLAALGVIGRDLGNPQGRFERPNASDAFAEEAQRRLGRCLGRATEDGKE